MQRIITSQTHSKTQDMQRDYYLNQKKTLEINPRHPLIKELLRRVEDNPADTTAKNMAVMMFNTATLRYTPVVHLFYFDPIVPFTLIHNEIKSCNIDRSLIIAYRIYAFLIKYGNSFSSIRIFLQVFFYQ